MYKVPISVIQECKDNLLSLIDHIENNCDLTKLSTQKRLKRAKKQVRILELNYGV